MLRIQVCAAHMSGFLGPKFSTQGSLSPGPSRAGPGPRVGHRSNPPVLKNLLIIFQRLCSPMHCYNAAIRWRRPPTHLSRHNFRCKISLSRV